MGITLEPSVLRRFVTLTEQKVSPKQVGKLYANAEMLAKLPVRLQRWIVHRAGGDPAMAFIVEPYCFFLAYEIEDHERAQAQLPAGYRLVPTSMFADGQPRYCAILGAFTVHASVFWGSRVELYVIAEHVETGMLTWVICDYESNTISYDPGEGFSGASTSRSVITTTHAGEVLVDVHSKVRPNRLTVTASLPAASMRALDQRLWIDGNLAVDYGGRLMDEHSVPFGLIFDPGEMVQALDVPLAATNVEENTFGAGFLAAQPFEAACFPYAQHFLTSSYPVASPIRDEQALAAAARSHADGLVSD
jgi:hypothetical protein